MLISDVIRILDANILCGADRTDLEIDSAFGSDMMSDVLAFVKDQSVLPTTLVLTGMINPHVIRTAEMLDVRCIVFVRGKQVSDDIIEEADEQGMVLLSTTKTLYTSSGLLYQAGLPACTRSGQA